MVNIFSVHKSAARKCSASRVISKSPILSRKNEYTIQTRKEDQKEQKDQEQKERPSRFEPQ